MGFLLIACLVVGVLAFLLLGNTHPATATVGGLIFGFVVWLFLGLFWLMGQVFDGCDSLDADNMCVETSYGEVRP